MLQPGKYDEIKPGSIAPVLSRRQDAGRNRYESLARSYAPKATAFITARRPNGYGYAPSLRLIGQPEPQHEKPLQEQLKNQPAAKQAQILVQAVKQDQSLLKDAGLWKSLNWEKQDLRGVIGLNTLPLNQIKMSGANLEGVDLRKAQLDGAQLAGANLSNAKMGEARMTGAQVQSAGLVGTDLGGATVTNADFNRSNLTRSGFDNVLGRGANFSATHGEDTRFSGQMQSTNYTSASYSNAAFGSGDFTGANFTGAKLVDPSGINALKVVEEGKRPTVSFTNAVNAIATNEPASVKPQDQKLQPQNVAALSKDVAFVSTPQRPLQMAHAPRNTLKLALA